MQRTVLTQIMAAIHTYRLMPREDALERFHCQIILHRLPVDRHEQMRGSDEIIGVCGRQAVPLLVVYRVGQRQFNQVERIAGGCAERAQLRGYEAQLFALTVPLSAVRYVDESVVRRHSSQRVDVAVRVITLKGAEVEPQHMVHT